MKSINHEPHGHHEQKKEGINSKELLMHTHIIVEQSVKEFNAKDAKSTQRAQRGKKGNEEKSLRSSLRVLCVYAFLFLFALCLAGCPVEPDDEWGGAVLKVTILLNDYDGEGKYYSLVTGEEADPHSANWDLGFYSIDNTPSIFTNSG
jgi:hypothetical protein